MSRLIQIKSNCTVALERCIRTCQNLISAYKYTSGMGDCIKQATICMEACVECLDACESAQFDRGINMCKCYEVCKASFREFQKYDMEECQGCVEACLLCIEELDNMIA